MENIVFKDKSVRIQTEYSIERCFKQDALKAFPDPFQKSISEHYTLTQVDTEGKQNKRQEGKQPSWLIFWSL